MSNRDLPMMPWYPDQFAAATSTWTYAEKSAYRALLDVQWQIGVLPNNVERLARAIGSTLSEMQSVWPVVRTKFSRVKGGLRNERLEDHRQRALKLKESKALGASITNENRARSASAQRTLSARQKPPRSAHATLHSSESVKINPKIKNPPPSQGLEAPPGAAKRRENAQNLQSIVKTLAAEKSLNGGHSASSNNGAREPSLGEKVRALGSVGNAVGDIVRMLEQYHLTAEQVERCLAGGEP